MARPTKQGVDYFPLDVHLDNKFKFIEIEYGLKGFAIVIKILQNIYSQGYWCEWGEDEKLLFASENRISFDELEEITSECIKREIFEPIIYEKYNVLTSKGIQKRYKEIVRRRKGVEAKEEYLLIDGSLGVNDDINPSLSSHDVVKSTQSKVKETKGNNYSAEFEEFWNVYPRKNDKQKAFKSFKTKRKEHSVETIVNGTNRYSDHLKRLATETRFIKYAATFLNNESFLDSYEESKDTSNQSASPSQRLLGEEDLPFG